MTGIELLTHALAVLGGAAPTAGFVIREREKRKSVEAEVEKKKVEAKTAESQALASAVTMAQTALEEASAAKKGAEKCEIERAADRKAFLIANEACEKRTKALYDELTRMREHLEASGALERTPPPKTIEEIVGEGARGGHVGYDEPADPDEG